MFYNENTLKTELDNFLVENACVSNGNVLHVLEENAKPYAADKTLDAIFESMLEKYSKINFEDIPHTKGDITKWKHYDNMIKCITSLLNFNSNTGKLPQAVILDAALKNVISLEPIFKEGFLKKNPYVILQYNVMVYSIFHGTSVLISSVMDFIQNGTKLELTINEYKGHDNILIISTLESFNSTVKDGTFVELMKKSMEAQSIKQESITLAGIAAAWKMAPLALKVIAGIWAGSKVIPLSKQLIYLIYAARTKISEAAELQAEFLRTNEVTLTNSINADNEEQVKKIIEKQGKVKSMFEKISRFFAVKNDHAEAETKREMNHEVKYNVDDFVI